MPTKTTKPKTETKEPEIKKETVIKTGIVNCGKLNVRKKPSLEAEIVAVISNGDKVQIKSTKDGWHEVKLSDGKKGCCMAEFITVK